jgi:protein O-mannosyl-transferase
LGSSVVVWLVWHSAVISAAADSVETYTYHNNSLVAAAGWNERIGTGLSMFSMYIGKLFWPSPLSYDYSFNEIKLVGMTDPLAILGLLLIGLFVFLTVKYFRRFPILVIGLFIFGATIALTSNLFFLIGATMADRFLFVPSLGFCIVLVWLLMRLDERKILGSDYFFVGSIAAFSILFLVMTWNRTNDWADEATLFTADVEHAPGSARVHFNYGTLVLGQAQNVTDQVQKNQLLTTAISHFQQAYKIDSLDAQSCFNMGVAYFRMKDYPNSLRWSRNVRRLMPQDKSVLANIGDAFTLSNEFDSAIVYLKQTIANGVVYKDTRNFLGYCYLNKRDTVQALATFRQAIDADPNYAEAWLKYANVLGMHHDFDESNKAFEKALELRPEDPNPLKMIATNYLMQKDTAKAQEYYTQYQKRGGK